MPRTRVQRVGQESVSLQALGLLCSSGKGLMESRVMCTGEANYFRDYKRLGAIAKLATSYQKEDGERGIDQEHIFYRVVLFLSTITVRLFSRILGVGDTPFRAVMGKRGDTGTEAGAAAMGAESSATGVTTVAASASETPSRCARAMRERVGASPRARRVASSAGRRAWIH